MTRRWLPFACLLLLLVPRIATAQAARFIMANEYPATSIQGEADARFARAVTERTAKRIEIVHAYDASSGFRSKDMVDAVSRAAVPIANAYMGALGAVDPVFLLPSLPFLATSPEQGKALADIARPAYERVLARHNQRLLFLSPWPAAGLWANKPIDSVEALKGLRLRTADAIPQLKAGQLDAVLSSGDGGAGARLMEVLKHFTAIEYAVTLSMVTINNEAWAALEPAWQQALLAAAAETEAQQWDIMKTRVTANYARMRAAGISITTALSPQFQQALRTAGQVAVDDWMQRMGPAAAPMLEAYRQRVGR
jgi:TRAP-type C4-dicarboxylate transport system substrate-binding protein